MKTNIPNEQTTIPNAAWSRKEWLQKFCTVCAGVPASLSAFMESTEWKIFPGSYMNKEESEGFLRCFPELTVEELSPAVGGRHLVHITKVTPTERPPYIKRMELYGDMERQAAILASQRYSKGGA
jgi:hypothetical protein